MKEVDPLSVSLAQTLQLALSKITGYKVVIPDQVAPCAASEFSEPTPVPRTAEPAAPAEPELTECEADILCVLRTAGRRLTTAAIQKALSQAGRLHGEGTVIKALNHLSKLGLVSANRCKPYGYVLKNKG